MPATLLAVISVSHSQHDKKGQKLIKSFQFAYISSRLQPQKQPVSVINITDPGKKGRGISYSSGLLAQHSRTNISSILKMIIKINLSVRKLDCLRINSSTADARGGIKSRCVNVIKEQFTSTYHRHKRPTNRSFKKLFRSAKKKFFFKIAKYIWIVNIRKQEDE